MEITACAITVTEASQIAEARREAVKQAHAAGLNDTGSGRAAIIATELCSNLIKHGGGGEFLVMKFAGVAGPGLQCIALDHGPGMVDLNACLQDGFSTAGSVGAGLGAVRRLSHEFSVYARPGKGTAVLARLTGGAIGQTAPAAATAAGIAVPVQGEQECGDAWDIRRHDGLVTMLVADGLGHGPVAATAARAAVACFALHYTAPLPEIVARIHKTLHETRGAAVAVARIDPGRHLVDFVGVGNVAGTLFTGQNSRKMVSHNGTAGLVARKIQQFSYGYEGTPLVVMHSDGLQTSWALDRYPGLAACHPGLIAAVLYRDFARGRDDVTVIAATVAASAHPSP